MISATEVSGVVTTSGVLAGKKIEWMSVTSSIDAIGTYRRAASLQMERIILARGSQTLAQHNVEVHFYLVCWRTIQNIFRHLKDCESLPSLKGISQSIEVQMKPYRDMRDHFDHQDERFPQGKRARHVEITQSVPGSRGSVEGRRISMMGVVSGDDVIMGDLRVNIAPSSLATLNAIVDEIFAAILKDCSRPNPQRQS